MTRTRFYAVAFVVAAMCAVASLALSRMDLGVRADTPATVRVEAPSQPVNPGESFEIRVVLDSTIESLGIGANLTFDPAIMALDTITRGSSFGDAVFVVGVAPQTPQQALADANSTGTLRDAAVYFVPGTGNLQAGEHVAFVIQAHGTGGGTSQIALAGVELLGLTGEVIDTTLVSGQVTVNGPTATPSNTATATPTPTLTITPTPFVGTATPTPPNTPVGGVTATPPAATLFVYPTEQQVASGSTFDIVIGQLAAVSTLGFQTTLRFDKSVLQIISIAKADEYEGAELRAGVNQSLDQAISEANATGSLINLAILFPNEEAGSAPPGLFITTYIRVQAIGATGTSSPIDPVASQIFGANGAPLGVVAFGASVSIVAVPTPTPTRTPAVPSSGAFFDGTEPALLKLTPDRLAIDCLNEDAINLTVTVLNKSGEPVADGTRVRIGDVLALSTSGGEVSGTVYFSSGPIPPYVDVDAGRLSARLWLLCEADYAPQPNDPVSVLLSTSHPDLTCNKQSLHGMSAVFFRGDGGRVPDGTSVSFQAVGGSIASANSATLNGTAGASARFLPARVVSPNFLVLGGPLRAGLLIPCTQDTVNCGAISPPCVSPTPTVLCCAALGIDPPSQEVSARSEFTVTIRVAASYSTAGVQTDLGFDPDQLQIVSIAKAAPYAAGSLLIGQQPQAMAEAIAEANATGALRNLGVFFVPPTSVPAGVTDVFVIRLRARDVSAFALLRLSNQEVIGADGRVIFSSAGGANVNIRGPEPTPDPNAPELRVRPAASTVVAGAIFNVDLVQTAPFGTRGIGTSLYFDDALLEVIDVAPGATYDGSSFLIGVAPQTEAEAISVGNQEGLLRNIALLQPSSIPSVPAGEHVAFTITFRARVGAAGSSELRLNRALVIESFRVVNPTEMLDAQYNEVDVSSISSSVEIVAAVAATATPSPTATSTETAGATVTATVTATGTPATTTPTTTPTVTGTPATTTPTVTATPATVTATGTPATATPPNTATTVPTSTNTVVSAVAATVATAAPVSSVLGTSQQPKAGVGGPNAGFGVLPKDGIGSTVVVLGIIMVLVGSFAGYVGYRRLHDESEWR